MYWAGSKFRGLTLTHVRRNVEGLTLGYGEPTCDSGSGCFHPLEVQSRPKRGLLTAGEDSPYRECFRPIHAAVLVGCEYSGVLLIGTEEVGIEAERMDISAVARSLRPLNARARPLTEASPARYRCARLRIAPKWLRRQIPREIQPRERC